LLDPCHNQDQRTEAEQHLSFTAGNTNIDQTEVLEQEEEQQPGL